MNWQYFWLKKISWLVCRLPYTLVVWLGFTIGFLHWSLGRSQRRRAIRQLQERLGVSADEAAQIARRMFFNIGRGLFEVLYTPALTPEKLARWVTIENPHYILEARGQGGGVVILTAHFGNWEWMAARLAQAGLPMTAVVETQPEAGFEQLLNEYRMLGGLTPFARGNALVAAMKALKSGKVLGFLADQDAKDKGIFVDFFGRPSSTPQGPAVFALRCGVPVVPAFIVRHPQRGHRIILSPPLYATPGADPEAEIERLTVAMTKVMENRIRSYPDHWWWFQRRWITNPKMGETSEIKP